MGTTGSGKSSFISHLTRETVQVGHSLESCTSQSSIYQVDRSGQTICIIDTPGFDDTNKSNAELFRDIALLLGMLHIRGIGIIGLVYLHRITDQRVGGSSLRSMQIFQSLCGIQCFPNVVLVTTMWDLLEQGDALRTGQSREKILKEKDEFWGQMVKGKAAVMHHDGRLESAETILSEILSYKETVVMDIQKELVDENLPLEETKVGRLLLEDIVAARERHQKNLSKIHEGLEDAEGENDEEMIATIAEEKRKTEASIEGIEDSEERLRITFEKLNQEGEGQPIVTKIERVHQQEEKLEYLERRIGELENAVSRYKRK
ncbi:P-loop containing nucleoside triphosphate hydrolase protein, partial [Glonium stellatum]